VPPPPKIKKEVSSGSSKTGNDADSEKRIE
jgi:hypothetical protein